MTVNPHLAPLILAATLLGGLVLLSPQSATAQLGDCFQCVDSDITECKICRHFTETGQDDCTTPECNTCGLANPCDPELAAVAGGAAADVLGTIREQLAGRTEAAEASGTRIAFATNVAATQAPAGPIAAVRRELSEHGLYLGADGSVRTCDGAQVGRIALPGPNRESLSTLGNVAWADAPTADAWGPRPESSAVPRMSGR